MKIAKKRLYFFFDCIAVNNDYYDSFCLIANDSRIYYSRWVRPTRRSMSGTRPNPVGVGQSSEI